MCTGTDLGGLRGPAPSPTPNFEAQIFVVALTLLRDVGEIWLAQTLHKSWIHTWCMYACLTLYILYYVSMKYVQYSH